MRKFVFKSSAHYYGYGHDDPAFFTEDMPRAHPARTPIERDVVDAEQAVPSSPRETGATIGDRAPVATAIGASAQLRCAARGCRSCPAIFGFDPRCQFIHEDDVVGVLEHAVRHDLPAPTTPPPTVCSRCPRSSSLLGKPMLPMMPPWGTAFAAAQLRRLGVPVPVEMLRELRFGRGLDNRRLKASRLRVPLYDPRGGAQAACPAAAAAAAAQRGGRLPLRTRGRGVPALEPERPGAPARSRRCNGRTRGRRRRSRAISGYDELSADELIGIIASLEAAALQRLRDYEASNQARPGVLEALDRGLSRPARVETAGSEARQRKETRCKWANWRRYPCRQAGR